MRNFIELHYLKSGDPVLINVNAISRVYVQHDTGETRVALTEDKNGEVDATICSRAAVYRVQESYEEVVKLIRKSLAEPIEIITRTNAERLGLLR